MHDLTAIIVFAHGSRDPLWHQPIEAVAQRLRFLQPDTPVACAYLELTEPSLTQACDSLLQQHPGVTGVRILPMFLGMGKHAREDLPMLVTQLRRMHPRVAFTLLSAVGETPAVLDAMAAAALHINRAD